MNTQSLGIAQTNVEIKLPGQSFPREHLSLNRCKSEIGSDQLTNANPLWGFGYSLIPEKNSQIHRRASTAAFLSVTSRPAREAIAKAGASTATKPNTLIFQELISSTPSTVGREFSESVYSMASNVPQPVLPHQYSTANTKSWNPMWSPHIIAPISHPLIQQPVVQATQRTETSIEIVKALKQVVATPKIEYMHFDGNPIKFISFMHNFETCLEKNNDDNGSRLQLLIQHCHGKTREAIETYVNLPAEEGYCAAKETLRENLV